MTKVVVYGWYNHKNIGDQLFIDAFHKLFPNFNFTFVDHLTIDNIFDADAVFFGGGSFLLEYPNITNDALQILASKKIFYLGVGIEANVHPIHYQLMKQALLIATRSIDQLDNLKLINPNTIYIPDLVYSLQHDIKSFPKLNKSVLVIPNISTVPTNNSPYWKQISWTHFKHEFCQLLDYIISNGYMLDFLPMCQDNQNNDDWAIYELIAHMNARTNFNIKTINNLQETNQLFSQYNLIVTQRYHGIILSELTRTPYIAIHHHDKLKNCYPSEGTFLSYYNCSKDLLIENFNSTIKMNFNKCLPEFNFFETLSTQVINLI